MAERNTENRRGKTVRRNLYNSIGLRSGYIMTEYDEMGRKTRESEYDFFGDPVKFAEYIYDTSGIDRVKIKRGRDSRGNILCREEHEYNDDSDKVHMTYFYNGKNVLTGKTEYEYDGSGKVVKEIRHTVPTPKNEEPDGE